MNGAITVIENDRSLQLHSLFYKKNHDGPEYLPSILENNDSYDHEVRLRECTDLKLREMRYSFLK